MKISVRSFRVLLVTFCAILSVPIVQWGCTTTGKPSPIVAQVAVQYATMKVVEKNPSYAPRVIEIARNVREATNGNASATVAVIDALIRSQIKWEKLAPSDRMVVDLLLQAIKDELTARIGSGVLDSDKLLVVAQVATWIETAAQASIPPAIAAR